MQFATAQRTGIRPEKGAQVGSSRLVLIIDGTVYALVPLSRSIGRSRRAYRLVKADGAVYDLSETSYGPACDCPDYIFRRDGLDPAGCKHIKALVRHGLIADLLTVEGRGESRWPGRIP